MKIFFSQLFFIFQILFFGSLIFLPNLNISVFLIGITSLLITFLITKTLQEKYLSLLAVISLCFPFIHGLWLITGLSLYLMQALTLVLLVSGVIMKYSKTKFFGWFQQHNGVFFAGVAVFTYMVLSPELAATCASSFATDFDSQNYLTWAYTAVKHYLPYKDVLYWYGLFSYYAASAVQLKILGIFWILGIILVVTSGAKQWLKNNVLLSLFLLLFISLSRMSAGWSALFRYGSAFALSVISAYVLSQPKIQTMSLFALGVLSSVLMLLISDQGIYFALILALQIFLASFLEKKQEFKVRFWHFVQRGFWCFLGFALSWIGIAIVMQSFGMWGGFVATIKSMGMLSIFAKVALSTLLFSKENIVTTIVLFVGTQLLLYEIFFKKQRKIDFRFLLQAAWLLVLWLCQNKFLIRPWFEAQFIFISFALGVLLLSRVLESVSTQIFTFSQKNLLLAITMLSLFAYLAPDRAVLDLLAQTFNQYRSQYKQIIQKPNFSLDSNQCLQNYFASFQTKAPPKYLEVTNWIAAQTNTQNPQIFSFPGEPIFYIINQQKPPAYFNAYDATAVSAQLENIRYMEDYQVQYVIWNIENLAIQDNVPNVLRNGLVAQFILTHFTAQKLIGNYLVFERSHYPVDFWHNSLIQSKIAFFESLQHQDLKLYPVVTNLKTPNKGRISLPEFTSASEVTIPTTLDQKKWYLKVTTSTNLPVKVEFYTGESDTASVSLTSCYEKKPCLIPLQQLPFFFTFKRNFTVQVLVDSPWRAQLVAQ